MDDANRDLDLENSITDMKFSFRAVQQWTQAGLIKN